jgi:hypothetical protein
VSVECSRPLLHSAENPGSNYDRREAWQLRGQQRAHAVQKVRDVSLADPEACPLQRACLSLTLMRALFIGEHNERKDQI